MKVYLSVPLVLNRSRERAVLMAKAITDSGNEVSSPWVLGLLESASPTGIDVFERDRRAVEESDAVIADVNEPSIGVGLEIMAAHKAGVKVILVSKRGRVVSTMLSHMQDKVTIEYDDESEIYPMILKALGRK
ncbi:MAG: hypothetical protein HY296_00980 [Thaumarchaeota archaeon]|nr:hypothetical protein [Nitrososphaerota archaeon]